MKVTPRLDPMSQEIFIKNLLRRFESLHNNNNSFFIWPCKIQYIQIIHIIYI